MPDFRTSSFWVGALFVLVSSLPAACSVGMAVSGEENPNLAVCTEGSTRLEIERELGAPKSSQRFEDGSYQCVYEYEVGDEPAPGRAAGHAVLDVLTLGIWEIAGTPIELTMGDKFELLVLYGPDDRAKELTFKQLE